MYLKNNIILSTGPYMRRFFFTVNDAIELIDQAIKNINKLKNKVLSVEMKSSRMIDFLKVWKKNYKVNYKIIENRKGDRLDEFLIGKEELKYSYSLQLNKKKYYVVDFNKLSKKPLKKIVSSQNAKKLTEKEIKNIIEFGLNSSDV